VPLTTDLGQKISLTGQATAAQLSVSPGSLTFPASGAGPVGLGLTSPPQTVTVTNTGTVPLDLGFGDCVGVNPYPCGGGSYISDFSLVTNTCANNTIPVGGTCTFSVDFRPSTTNQETETLDLYDNAATSLRRSRVTVQVVAGWVRGIAGR
jgi:hypothetical protein